MSRKGKKPIPVPKGTEVKFANNKVSVKGPKGLLELEVKDGVQLQQENDELLITYDPKLKDFSKFQGLYHSLIENLIVGTNSGFTKQLELIGVGYRAAVKGHQLDLSLGFSHPTLMDIPEGIEVKVDNNTKVSISGIDKQKVGQFSAKIRALKPPEPYKGKGVRYSGEYVRKKAGKSGK